MPIMFLYVIGSLGVMCASVILSRKAPPKKTIGHSYKAKTNTSCRTRILPASVEKGDKVGSMTRRANKRAKKKQKRLDDIIFPPGKHYMPSTSHIIPRKQLKDMAIVYNGGSKNSRPNGVPSPKENPNLQVHHVQSSFEVLDPTDGLILNDPKYTDPIAQLAPRSIPLKYQPNDNSNTFTTLDTVLSNSKDIERGEGREVYFEDDEHSKYFCNGHYANRNRSGLSERPQYMALRPLIRRIEQVVKEVVNPRILRGFFWAQNLVKFPSMCEMFAAIGGGLNVFLQSHRDKDAFYSVIHIVKEFLDGDDKKYTMDDKVCCYFCFPEQGVAIALRPGDVLVFNPDVYHSVSSRAEGYEGRFFCLSLYLKTAHVGLHDNKKPLTEEQEEFAQSENLL